MPNTRKTVPLSKELVQRERETTEMSLLNKKGETPLPKSKASSASKSGADKQTLRRKSH